ncbi:MAG: hypothetical protein ABT940_06855 [Alphaproteobacteria bacterium]
MRIGRSLPCLLLAFCLAVDLSRTVPAWAGGGGTLATPTGYRVDAQFPARSRGLSQIALLVDTRINVLVRDSMEEFYLYGFTSDTEIAQLLEKEALAEARLVLYDDQNGIANTTELGSPFARLRTAGPPAPDTFVLETTHGGFGQFNGVRASLLVIDHGTVRRLSAVDDDTGTTEEIQLLRSRGSDWRILTTPRRPGSVFQVLCRPDEADDKGFGETYITYRLEKSVWHRRQQTGRGYCTWPDGFPPLRSFP